MAGLLAATIVGVYGLGFRTSTLPAERPSPAAASPVAAASPADRLAVRVAEALFGWDTTMDSEPGDAVQRLMAVADPPVEEAAGLERDLAYYLPTADAWAQLREYGTRQELIVQRVFPPTTWSAVDTSILPQGIHARTVEGIRVRHGHTFGADIRTEHPVSFTIFLTCPPDGGRCVALRVSRLNDPLP
ncbi:hypothetical protein [Microbacterium sp. No. 7]|uniref:hypothetical protein n=1 Tax=Microbacterium sp. No. 7 TaxID=1714373 RepID=UPI0012E260A7|nr:hypothetical protein [Microbacterium sp. No. 7]